MSMITERYPLASQTYEQDIRQLYTTAWTIILLACIGVAISIWIKPNQSPLWTGFSAVISCSAIFGAIMLYQHRRNFIQRLGHDSPITVMKKVKSRTERLASYRQRLYPLLFITIILFLILVVGKVYLLCGAMAGVLILVSLAFAFILLEQLATSSFYTRVHGEGDD